MVEKETVFILGSFRSGTSVLSKVVSHFGYSPGPEDDLFPPTPWNTDGYYQRPDVTHFNTRLIENTGGEIGDPPHPDIICKKNSREFKKEIDLNWCKKYEKILIKDPRLCFTLKYWIENSIVNYKNIKILFITRSLDDVAESCLLHYDVKNYVKNNKLQSIKTTKKYNKYANWHISKFNLNSLILSFDDLVYDTLYQINRISNFLECKDSTLIEKAVNSMLTGRSEIRN